MNTENFVKFSEILASSPALQEKIKSLDGLPRPEAAEKMAAYAAEAGAPISADAFRSLISDEVSLEDLEKVAGGFNHLDPEMLKDPQPFTWHEDLWNGVKGFFENRGR